MDTLKCFTQTAGASHLLLARPCQTLTTHCPGGEVRNEAVQLESGERRHPEPGWEPGQNTGPGTATSLGTGGNGVFTTDLVRVDIQAAYRSGVLFPL